MLDGDEHLRIHHASVRSRRTRVEAEGPYKRGGGGLAQWASLSSRLLYRAAGLSDAANVCRMRVGPQSVSAHEIRSSRAKEKRAGETSWEMAGDRVLACSSCVSTASAVARSELSSALDCARQFENRQPKLEGSRGGGGGGGGGQRGKRWSQRGPALVRKV
eukprot:2839912-Pleurochrysis_carterae.AAC.3